MTGINSSRLAFSRTTLSKLRRATAVIMIAGFAIFASP